MILKAKESDFESILILLNQLWPNHKFSKKKTQTTFFKTLKMNNIINLVLKKQDKIIGFASIKFSDDLYEQGKIGFLSELIIDESFRGQGFGTELLREIISQSKKNGCVKIQLITAFRRKRAHKFYESLGFDKSRLAVFKKNI